MNINNNFENEKSFNNKMQYKNKKNLREIFNIEKSINIKNKINIQDNKINQKIKMKKIQKDFNSKEKGLINNNNYSQNYRIFENISKDDYNSYNINHNNFSSLQIYPYKNKRIRYKKQETSGVDKNRKEPNFLIINNKYHNYSRNLSQNPNDIKITDFKKESYISTNTNTNKTLFIKINPKIFPKYSSKIINSSNNIKKNYNENELIKNNSTDKDNSSFYINRYKTEEVDNNYRPNNNYENKLNRINKYKIIRNKIN